MPRAGDTFIVTLEPAHLGGGTYRYTDTRDSIYREGYIKMPRQYAERFGIFNSNHRTANSRYRCVAVNGDYSDILLAQGCSSVGGFLCKTVCGRRKLKGYR
ncbi:MAG: hypothetical protein J6C64_02570 [Lachnospiraceae bacterium]|nr:hypothetical protein [Lachnospiraceae bacterium]